jgi:hypothetical protein
MSTQSPLAPDAEMVLGMAATAIPFARSPEAQAERWLRVLRLHGEVGSALRALGVSEVSSSTAGAGSERRASSQVEDRDVIALVTERAVRVASERGAGGVATTDVLIAVMYVYGEDFERVLRAHGADPYEVLERLGGRVSESSED